MRRMNAHLSPCVFCNIINGLDDTELLFEDDEICVFRDIKPASSFHILAVPKRHIEDVKSLTPSDKQLDTERQKRQKDCLYISTLNTRTLRTDEALCELEDAIAKIKWDIIGLSEVRRTGGEILDLEHMYTTAKDLVTKNDIPVEDARFGYHWPPFRSVKHLHLHAIAPESEMGLLSRMIFRKDSYWFVSPEYVERRLTTGPEPYFPR